MRFLGESEFREFLRRHAFAVIHFDAVWDKRGLPLVRSNLAAAEQQFGALVGFAEVDVDRETQLAVGIGLINVPTVAYFRFGKLESAIFGEQQDIAELTSRLLMNLPLE